VADASGVGAKNALAGILERRFLNKTSPLSMLLKNSLFSATC